MINILLFPVDCDTYNFFAVYGRLKFELEATDFLSRDSRFVYHKISKVELVNYDRISNSHLHHSSIKNRLLGWNLLTWWFLSKKNTIWAHPRRYLCAASWNSIIASSNLPIAWSTKGYHVIRIWLPQVQILNSCRRQKNFGSRSTGKSSICWYVQTYGCWLWQN